LKTYDANEIRNVLLVGHAGAGKTSLLEAMLFTAGAVTRMGTVEEGNTVSDHDPDEQRRQLSVSLAMAPIEWKDTKINVLDAPGTADFVGDLRNAIRAVDAVIVVVSAVDGVEVQTEYAWELAVDEGLPRAIFVNKFDRERADFEGTLAQLVSSFGNQVALFDPKTEKFTEYMLPPYTFPYRANFDKNGEIWASTMHTDRVVRLDPKTGTAVQYLMPSDTNMRTVFVDSSTTPTTFWVGSNHDHKIVKVEPLD